MMRVLDKVPGTGDGKANVGEANLDVILMGLDNRFNMGNASKRRI